MLSVCKPDANLNNIIHLTDLKKKIKMHRQLWQGYTNSLLLEKHKNTTNSKLEYVFFSRTNEKQNKFEYL